MNYNIPARQIFLEDGISLEKTGVSTLTQRKRLANRLYAYKYLSYASIASFLTFGYLTLNKTYTNRKVYFISFFASTLITSLALFKVKELRGKCLEEFKCKQEELNDYAWFYNYSIIDPRRN